MLIKDLVGKQTVGVTGSIVTISRVISRVCIHTEALGQDLQLSHTA